ncbi:MAG: hypothetical protein OXQ90_10240 [Gammaproteobacteria bacterium]|nr:hypothetical protein [Gammaproteobacteria bacterium]
MDGSTVLSGFANARALAVVCVVAAVVAICVAQFREPAGEPATEDLAAGTPPAEPEEPSEPTLAVADVPADVFSRVDAAPVTVETQTGGSGQVSHIGPPLDPDAERHEPSNATPSHIGEYLDPDDDSVSRGSGETSHIGKYLNPLADESGGTDG